MLSNLKDKLEQLSKEKKAEIENSDLVTILKRKNQMLIDENSHLVGKLHELQSEDR